MTTQLIECVPNISEGRDLDKINTIAHIVETVEGVKLLDIDPGKATNRTVITFVGNPQNVIDAAFLLIKRASELIDMSKHHGEHPRFGATDVCPLVPISGISLKETAKYAHKLGERVGEELNIPGYYYEIAATEEKRKNLANCRAGEYEGLKHDIRENGRIKLINGKKVLDSNGKALRIPGKLKAVKGLGWYIEEYGIAQISYNLTNISITPVHIAFDETCLAAQKRGLRVTGSELIGLIPLKAMLDAADYFLTKQERSLGISESEKIKIAVKSLGLDDLKPFNPNEKIIEYVLKDNSKKLVDLSITNFADETASESMAPGGGSISAYVGALGVSLGTMVANLSAHKAGWDNKWEIFSNWAVKGQAYKNKLLFLVDEDTNSFNKIIEAFKLPKKNKEEKATRLKAVEEATKYATEIPLLVMETAYNSMEIMKAMVTDGLQNSISDTGVGALCARTAVTGAFFNVRINAKGLKDRKYAENIILKATNIYDKAVELENEIINIIDQKI